MQAVCGKCGAKYEFDSSAIPAAGYNAQCTNCDNVFFVAPEGSAPEAAAEPPVAEAETTLPELEAEPAPLEVEAIQAAPVDPIPEAQPELAPVEAEPVPVESVEPMEPLGERQTQPAGISVAPAAEATAPDAGAADGDMLSISCPSCNAGYQFAKSAIPAAGYDAQCTQCNNVFFVSPDGSSKADAHAAVDPADLAASLPEHAPDESMHESVADSPSPAEEPLLLSEGEDEAAPQATTPAPTPMAETGSDSIAMEAAGEPLGSLADDLGPGEDPDQDDLDDMMALNQELGDPMSDVGDVSGDFAHIARKGRRQMAIVGGSITVVLGAVLGLYAFAPSTFDETIGPMIGVKAQVKPEAVAKAAEGAQLMLLDNSSSYEKSIRAFSDALAIDRVYPEGLAQASISHLLYGVDFQRAGQIALADGQKALEEIATLTDRPRDRRRREALAVKVASANSISKQHYERGGALVSTALKLLKEAMKIDPSHPQVRMAAALYYANDRDSVVKAQKHLDVALESLEAAPLNLKSPPDEWAPYVYGVIMRTSGKPVEARAAFEAAAKKNPAFVRARYEVAAMVDTEGKAPEALALANGILKEHTGHTKSLDMSSRLTPPPAPPEPPKGKRRRGRRRRAAVQ